MYRTLCKSKIHRATVTGADLNYVGSITIDSELMQAADILPYERVQVVDVDNGARLETYVIAGEPGGGVIQLNGAAARLVAPGDTVIIVNLCGGRELESGAKLMQFMSWSATPWAAGRTVRATMYARRTLR